MKVADIDPMRITERLFGGPFFKVYDTETDELPDPRELAKAWMEGRNLPPKGTDDE